MRPCSSPAPTSSSTSASLILWGINQFLDRLERHRRRDIDLCAARIAPDLVPAAFAHLLDRSTGEAEEHEAETIASLIHQRVRVRPQLAIDVVPPAAAQRLTRVEY
jgi:hypothetical protein